MHKPKLRRYTSPKENRRKKASYTPQRPCLHAGPPLLLDSSLCSIQASWGGDFPPKIQRYSCPWTLLFTSYYLCLPSLSINFTPKVKSLDKTLTPAHRIRGVMSSSSPTVRKKFRCLSWQMKLTLRAQAGKLMVSLRVSRIWRPPPACAPRGKGQSPHKNECHKTNRDVTTQSHN